MLQANRLPTFNRTTMELKLVFGGLFDSVVDPFNRTTMELKPSISNDGQGESLAFNRTTMELKPMLAQQRGLCLRSF